ncbi:MAG: hypothetical protein IJ955_11020, partial [Oscillospiraceae bacterium]|nr:hypothetical protein [Oscillospiraceae bacterium]
VTRPVFYKELLLNNLDVVNSIDVASLGILPEGYTLYDEKAKYSIVIHSDSTGEWSIVSSADKTQSTYVTGFSDTIPFSNVSSEDNDAYDYTHTTVWFAVLWIPSTIPDYIVIDYGLPVDISVLVNDQFGDYGRIVGLGTLADQAALGIDENELYSTSKSDRFTNPAGGLQLTHGKISIAGNKVRYVLDDMNSAGVDTFVYEVEFTYYEHFENGLPVGAPQLRYFYGVVTVIPATIIYYEESFVEFSNSATPEGELGTWKDITDESYNADANITQAEDRPGFFSLALIDANNIYGFDQAYQNFTQYSLGSAKMVNVNAATGSMQNAPKVTFSFTGTGFDIISLTNSESGTILVTVEGSGGFKKTKAVDNYYGYKYNAETGKWEVYPDVTPDCIWQVPVIKFDNLAFDTYTVTIQLAYMDALDHIEDDSYCFWMDAVRIYDPADTSVVVNPESGVTIGGIYEQDRENQPYFETLRDLLIADLTGTDGAPHISGELPGVVFIDGKSETNSVVDYQNPGPNHETYLAHTQGIAFRLVANQKPISVHLGVKLAHGNSATLMLNDAGFVTVNTATDRYFDLGAKLIWKESTSNGMTVWSTDTIYLSNNSANTIISLTNLKCVGAIAELDNEYGGAGTGNEASSGLTVQSSLGNSASSYQTRQNTKEMPFSV